MRFGFDAAGVGFDQQPFRGSTANDAVYPLPDVLYRRLILARATLIYGAGTLPDLVTAIEHLDPDAVVVDNRNMTVTVHTGQQALIELGDTIGALPRPAGVRLIYAAPLAADADLVWGADTIIIWGDDTQIDWPVI